MWVPERSRREEMMDRPGHGAETLRGALRDIGVVNRWLGGRRALLDALRPLMAATRGERPFEVLDVGTGGADLAIETVRLGWSLDRDVRVVAVDSDACTAGIAAEVTSRYPEIRVIAADGFRLPFAERSFDVVTASLFLHHFPHGQIVELLERFRAVARRAVVVNDLRRHRLPWAFILLAARVTARHAMFRHDAPLSVLRGFTPDELLTAAHEAGAERPLLRCRWPFRLALTVDAAGVGLSR
jgi:SAM-dependent methyltransferase